jgi:uncharacterized membrane protein SpoIIM required for sporulation
VSGSSLFLIAFTALAIAPAIVDYLRSVNKGDLERHESLDSVVGDHIEEITMVWVVFLAVLAGFLTAHISGLTGFKDVSLDGADALRDTGLQSVITNNVFVAIYTFLLSFVSIAGLVFVLTWNAALLASYASQTDVLHVFLVLPHGLLEVAGYVFAGLAGSLLTVRLQNDIDDGLWARDLTVLLVVTAVFIIAAGLIETL